MDATIPSNPFKHHSLRNQLSQGLLNFCNHVANALFQHPPLCDALERVLSATMPSQIGQYL
jgi:hypothetical protein